MPAKRAPFDSAAKAILRYRTLADQARFNAEKAVDEAGREWFLALAKTMTELADALEGHRPG
jgi:predicted hydrocarbon binding protein